MRVIAGTRRGIPLKSITGTDTRPTSDKVKEALFSKIGPFFNGGIAVELFGGSGSLTLEALSRGSDSAWIFEKNSKACAVIKENAEKCKFTEELHIVRGDARSAAVKLAKEGIQADLLFLDPPYAKEELYNLAMQFVELELLTDHAIIVCEHEKHLTLPTSYGVFETVGTTVYGGSALTIYKK
ncbi:16S rRNA (guanine(966)-N(2))-methyltransferase RsmD [Sporosarcina sp. BI001-red]|uniref:16S rRNA (guanine(966)-N(2))-methyltransferase RsmD n=1 Tax=Sporosarcina sp. BI001-red TaxID=2282866 RepID=UPI000E2413B3|nr:16S rRNA (guanine(966)-N(2))-methyltransferase RsmD [Sporosarcina sp. BI001-red]REB09655.1 16S rRNA (guanine(966)-N(2))-methyltransferase RsmD [Sporosarcina sp. BI001-red]